MTSPEVLEGVGPALADRLDEAGYRCLEQLAHSTLSEACRIKGVSPDLVLAAQEYLESEREWTRRNLVRKAKQECWCRHCGKHFNSLDSSPLLVHRRRCSENDDSPDRFQ
jgi:hypothetical protein